MYEQYINSATKLYNSLVNEQKSQSKLCFTRTSIRKFLLYLKSIGKDYSIYLAADWIESLRTKIDHTSYKSIRYIQYLIALDIDPQNVTKKMFYKGKLNLLDRVEPWGKKILEEYIIYLPKDTSTCFIDGACRLLEYLQNIGCTSYKDITCQTIISYRTKTFNSCTNSFLNFLEQKGYVNRFVAKSYSVFYTGRFEDFKHIVSSLPKSSISLETYINAYEKYVDSIRKQHYSTEILKAAKSSFIQFGILMCIYHFNYSIEAVEAYVSYLHDNFNLAIMSHRKVLLSLSYIINNENPPEVLSKKEPFPIWFAPFADKYKNYRKQNHLASSTLNMDRSSLLRFSKYLDSLGINHINLIKREHIKQFFIQDVHKTVEGKSSYSIKIKLFLEFLEDNHIIDIPLSKAMPTCISTKLRPTESIDDETYNVILNNCQKWEQQGNYLDSVIIKIGLWLGLRSIDIANLCFNNINWNKQEISLCQQKTNVCVTIPFPTNIGNLIYDYIRKQRPKHITTNNIFINKHAPFKPITRCYIRRKLIKASNNIVTKSHMLRKTFATRMLKNNTAITKISNALGHVSNETVDPYLDIHWKKMIQCGISLDTLKY